MGWGGWHREVYMQIAGQQAAAFSFSQAARSAPPYLFQEVQAEVDVLCLPQLRMRQQPRLAHPLAARQVNKVKLAAPHNSLPCCCCCPCSLPPSLNVQGEDAVGAGGCLVEGGLSHHAVGVAQEQLRQAASKRSNHGGWVGGLRRKG